MNKLTDNVTQLSCIDTTNNIIDTNVDNFISKNTTFTVKTDGTGDFTTIQDAFDYLNNKWSNGQINISIGAGTYSITSQLYISGQNNNIPFIYVNGAGKDNTIVSTTSQALLVSRAHIKVENIGFVCTNSTQQRGATAENGGILEIGNCSFENFAGYCPGVYVGGTVIISNSLQLTNCTEGWNAEAGIIKCAWGRSHTFTNVALAIHVNGGGMVQGAGCSCTFTNVTTKYYPALGTANKYGFITGFEV